MDTEINKILVVGAGLMGHGIAQCFAQAGLQVFLVDVQPSTLERARELIRSNLQTLSMAGLISTVQEPEILNRIQFDTSLESVAGQADFAIECVVEDKDVKSDVFNQLDRLCRPGVLLASNTTALNLFDFIHTSRPEQVLICHWYTPPYIIPMVDVVKGPQTALESVELTVKLLRRAGKQPVVMNKFVPGYVIPRLQMALQREVFHLLDNDVISAEDLDDAVKSGLALRMLVLGVLGRIDYGGLDLTVRGLKRGVSQDLLTPADYQPRQIFELVEQGHLGVKSGRGFFDYSEHTEAEYYQQRDIKLIRLLKFVQ